MKELSVFININSVGVCRYGFAFRPLTRLEMILGFVLVKSTPTAKG